MRFCEKQNYKVVSFFIIYLSQRQIINNDKWYHITSYVDIDTRTTHSLPPSPEKIELNLTVIIIYYSNFYYILKILFSCKKKKKNDVAGIMARVFSCSSRIDGVSEVFTGYKIWKEHELSD